MSIFGLTIVMIAGLFFGFGTVWLIKAHDAGMFSCEINSKSKYNTCYWERLDNGTYRGTFNGKPWKTNDETIIDTINWYIGRDIIVDIDDILNGSVVILTETKQNDTDSLIDKYDKLLSDIEAM